MDDLPVLVIGQTRITVTWQDIAELKNTCVKALFHRQAQRVTMASSEVARVLTEAVGTLSKAAARAGRSVGPVDHPGTGAQPRGQEIQKTNERTSTKKGTNP